MANFQEICEEWLRKNSWTIQFLESRVDEGGVKRYTEALRGFEPKASNISLEGWRKKNDFATLKEFFWTVKNLSKEIDEPKIEVGPTDLPTFEKFPDKEKLVLCGMRGLQQKYGLEANVNHVKYNSLKLEFEKPVLEYVERNKDIINFWRCSGPPEHWITTIERHVWGLNKENMNRWGELKPGDVVIFYSTKQSGFSTNGYGVIGAGVIGRRWMKDELWWHAEHKNGSNTWPCVFDFEQLLMIPEKVGRDRSIKDKDSKTIQEEVHEISSNSITLEEIAEKTGRNFPFMGSISALRPEVASKVVDLIAQKAGVGSPTSAGPVSPPPHYSDLQRLLSSKNQIILYGPPGTGKTCKAREFAVEFIEKGGM